MDSKKYIGMDVHKEAIAIAVRQSSTTGNWTRYDRCAEKCAGIF
jgi:hypothetical protein